MSRLAAFLGVAIGIFCAGLVDSALFQFNTSPMTLAECSARPMNQCGAFSLKNSDCFFLQKKSPPRRMMRRQAADTVTAISTLNTPLPMGPSGAYIITHVNLKCTAPAGNIQAQLPTRQELKAQVSAIRKRSKDRAVYVELWSTDLFTADLLGPIGSQIVSLRVSDNTHIRDPSITMQIPLLNMTNLLDITFDLNSQLSFLNIKKGHFSSLQHIRAIAFIPWFIGTIEAGTFTDLPSLIFLGLEKHPFNKPDDSVEYKAYQKLHCDAENSWLWEWLARNPSLQNNRDSGQAYRIGSLKNEVLQTEDIFRNVEVSRNGTLADICS